MVRKFYHSFPEVLQSRFLRGTFEKMDSLLSESESRAELIRFAVQREIERRERAKAKEMDK